MKRPLKHYIRECGTRNKEQGCTAVYSVTNSQGFVPSTDYFSKEVYSKDLSNYKIVKRGMIAYNPSRVNVGSLAVQNAEDQVIVSPLYVVFSVDETQLLPEYICYFLHSDLGMKEISAHTSGSVRDSLKFSALQNIEITIRPVTEQEEIITLLRKIESIIEKRKRTLKKIDELVKSQFIEMFGDPAKNDKGWKQTTLKEVAKGKLSYGSGASAVEYDGETRYIRITDITDNGELSEDRKSPSVVDEKYLLHDGDILFARSGATVGKTFLYRSTDGRGIYAGYLIRIIPNQDMVLPQYVFNYTKTDYYASFVRDCQRAVAQPNINAQEYGNLMICVPPIELQEQFTRFVEQTDKSKIPFEMEVAA